MKILKGLKWVYKSPPPGHHKIGMEFKVALSTWMYKSMLENRVAVCLHGRVFSFYMVVSPLRWKTYSSNINVFEESRAGHSVLPTGG